MTSKNVSNNGSTGGTNELVVMESILKGVRLFCKKCQNKVPLKNNSSFFWITAHKVLKQDFLVPWWTSVNQEVQAQMLYFHFYLPQFYHDL